MSKLETNARQIAIIRTLQKNAYNFNDLKSTIEREFETRGYTFKMGIRTFQRDIQEILSLHGIEILYNRSDNNYYIDGQISFATERIFESVEISNALKLSEGVSEYLYFENRKADGSEHLYILLHAIKNKLAINFEHQKYFESKVLKTAEPLALKEYKKRWYLIARELDKQHTVAFGLDRITNIETTNQKFKYPAGYNVEEVYKYAFGIMAKDNTDPAQVVLCFTAYQGKYIKSLPLHHTQVIIIDNDTELRIKLTIYITYDFIMELLSFGDTVKIIKPKSLITELKKIYQNALKQY